MDEVRGIIDSHSHYDSTPFDTDRDELLTRMLAEGSPVAAVIHAATDVDSMQFGIGYAARFPRFYTSVGFHPELTAPLPKEPRAVLAKMLSRSDKICAVGEIGLDYHYEGYDRELQIGLLRMQLEFAREHSLPVILHCRDATLDFMELMREYKPKGVVHCFSGSAETAGELVSLGLYLGFGGVLTFKNARRVKAAFAKVPEDRFLFETDCPYLAPEPFRGQRCDSFMIENTALCAAEIKGIPAGELVSKAAENTVRLFGIEV